MQIQRLQISNIRNLSRVSLHLNTTNIFFGVNGSGKTSLLEAVHLLLVGRSFRQTQVRPILSEGQDESTVFAELIAPDSSKLLLGSSRQRSGGKPTIKLNGAVLNTISELVQIAPVQILFSESFELLMGGPSIRRSFLDWGLFHVEHGFYAVWQQAQRALKQRNSLIRHGKINSEQLGLWGREYARYGERLDVYRQQYVSQLLTLFRDFASKLLPQLPQILEVVYSRGWSQDHSLMDALELGLEGDMQQGYTRAGPHRADLKVRAGSFDAADLLSRGQVKLLVAALFLAQITLLKQRTGKSCVLLVDDLAAELDAENRQKLCAELEALGVQVLVTSVSQEDLTECWSKPELVSVFHVEHGNIHPVTKVQ